MIPTSGNRKEKMTCPFDTRGLSPQEYINWLQRYIIVHSYIYYERNNNVISDQKYDEKAKELTAMKKRYPDLWRKSEYYKQFGDDYNGSTGFTLFHGLTEKQQQIIISISNMITRKE